MTTVEQEGSQKVPEQQQKKHPGYDPELVDKLILKYKALDKSHNRLADDYKVLTEDNRILNEKIKHLEKKNQDNLKNLSTSGLSRNDIKKQYESEITQLKETLSIMEKGIDDKNTEILKLREEIEELRLYLDEERKRTENYFSIAKSKSKDLEIYKTAGENTSLRSKNLELETQRLRLTEELDKLKHEKAENEKKLKENLELMRGELNLKNKSYNTLTSNLQSTTQVLYNTTKDYESLKFQFEKMSNEHYDQSLKMSYIERENINLKTEVEESRKIIKRRDAELADYEKRIREFQFKINEGRRDAQVFEVFYNQYLMKNYAKFYLNKEEEVYWFTIETKFNSRKYQVLDIEMYTDSNEEKKVVVRFTRSNEKEENYYSDEYRKVIAAFSEFKKNAIEQSRVGEVVQAKNPVNINRARENINNFLEF